MGACEFAKRFRIRGLTVDVSPLPLKKLATVRSPLGWSNFMLTLQRPLRLSTQLRLSGLGFKASSRPLGSKRHGIRCRRLLIMRLYGLLPTTLWLATALGFVPSPVVIGRVLDRLAEHFVQKDLITAPEKISSPIRVIGTS